MASLWGRMGRLFDLLLNEFHPFLLELRPLKIWHFNFVSKLSYKVLKLGTLKLAHRK